ncbi:MAG: YraN family protein [Sulfurovaceae bacterium]|nr:YraN family protein [Sulfurovaceae bacterium]
MTNNCTKGIGDQNETLATKFLANNGYIIVERNYYARKLGEIDIIASKEKILHFIEVKSANADFDPIYNVTPNKIKKVINSAYYFLKERKLDMPFCIDALIIRQEKIEFIENITL